MANSLVKRTRRVAFRVVKIQLAALVVAAVFAGFIDRTTSLSVFVGGMICVIPASYFAFKAFSVVGAIQAQQVVKAFYLGEAVKLLLTVALFVVAFKWLPIAAPPLLIGYFITLCANWLATGLLKTGYF